MQMDSADRTGRAGSAPPISVIVPVCNVEPYLDRCVQSVADQTYMNLEIILVDDGSPDNCPAMCDAWAEKDSRVRVIHKENGGLSDARNAGMAAASGEYIAFVDSDDWVEPDFLRVLYDVVRGTPCDVAGCAHRVVRSGDEPPQSAEEYGAKAYSREEAMGALIADRVRQVVWNKLYPRALIADIPFEKGKYHEDEFWSWQVFARLEKYAQTGYVGYNYFQREESIMGEGYSLKRLDAVEAKLRRQRFLEAEMPELARRGRINLLFTCLYHGQLAQKYLQGDERKQALSALQEAVKRYPLTREDKETMRFTHRVWARLAETGFVSVCRLRNILRIGS